MAPSFSQRIAEVQQSLAKVNATISEHLAKTLPQLWNSLSALRVIPILQADYDAKLARQEQRSLMLDKVSLYP